MVATAITYYFGSLHASAAEGLQTSVMVEYQIMGDYNYMLRCLPVTSTIILVPAKRTADLVEKGQSGWKLLIFTIHIMLLSLSNG